MKLGIPLGNSQSTWLGIVIFLEFTMLNNKWQCYDEKIPWGRFFMEPLVHMYRVPSLQQSTRNKLVGGSGWRWHHHSLFFVTPPRLQRSFCLTLVALGRRKATQRWDWPMLASFPYGNTGLLFLDRCLNCTGQEVLGHEGLLARPHWKVYGIYSGWFAYAQFFLSLNLRACAM